MREGAGIGRFGRENGGWVGDLPTARGGGGAFRAFLRIGDWFSRIRRILLVNIEHLVTEMDHQLRILHIQRLFKNAPTPLHPANGIGGRGDFLLLGGGLDGRNISSRSFALGRLDGFGS